MPHDVRIVSFGIRPPIIIDSLTGSLESLSVFVREMEGNFRKEERGFDIHALSENLNNIVTCKEIKPATIFR